MMTNCAAKGFLLGLLVGSVAGGAAALLLTPQSGKETRELIENKTAEAKDALGQKVHSLQDVAAAKVDEAKEVIGQKVQSLQDVAATKIEGVKSSASDLMTKAKGVIEEYVPQSTRVKLAKDVGQKIEDGLVHLAES